MPFASSYYGLLQQKVPVGYNEHTQNVLTLGPHICMAMGLHACQYNCTLYASTMVFKVMLINKTRSMA